ncbi:MAG TPA: hypothetical protein VJT73_14165, partial [Polyangiaceae bacterium]|nr:hypothetical protein [Polyangiaceae bacterium]
QKLDPGVGTQFHLADCYERLGQTASAWAGFLEVASGAKAMGQVDRERVARERATALQPRLSKMTLVSSGSSPPPGLEIRRDGTVVGHALWGTAIPVDPGSHSIEATAPGKKPFRTTVQVTGENASVSVTIPALDDAPAPPVVVDDTTKVTSRDANVVTSGTGRTLGLIVGGAGVVGLGISGAFALRAKGKYDDSLDKCLPGEPNKCFESGVTLRNEARSAGTVATVAFGVGAAAIVAGAVLFFAAPSPAEKPRVSLVPSVGPGSAELTLLGSY